MQQSTGVGCVVRVVSSRRKGRTVFAVEVKAGLDRETRERLSRSLAGYVEGLLLRAAPRGSS